MVRFFCEYCDVFLPHEAMMTRREHKSGRRHKDNVAVSYRTLLQRNPVIFDRLRRHIVAAAGSVHGTVGNRGGWAPPMNSQHAPHQRMMNPDFYPASSQRPPLPLQLGAPTPSQSAFPTTGLPQNPNAPRMVLALKPTPAPLRLSVPGVTNPFDSGEQGGGAAAAAPVLATSPTAGDGHPHVAQNEDLNAHPPIDCDTQWPESFVAGQTVE